MLIVPQAAVSQLLNGRESEIIGLVSEAYRLHDEGRTALPHSVFLRFPADAFPGAARDRIIGLPGYAGGDAPVAGMKWISSFPGNVAAGRARASAVIVLNSLDTGHPQAVVEGSVISAKRTAASAALAASLLIGDRAGGVGLIGCGVINFEVLRFLATAVPGLASVTVHDLDRRRATEFAARAATLLPGVAPAVAEDAEAVLAAHPLLSIATTAAEPYLDLKVCQPGSVVLHVSLRDLTPSSILDSVNVVDDPDHVCRERTSLHLAEQLTGDRTFIAATIGQLVRGTAQLPPAADAPVVFSPFGLGVLDLVLAEHVRAEALRQGLGVRVDDFLTPSHT